MALVCIRSGAWSGLIREVTLGQTDSAPPTRWLPRRAPERRGGAWRGGSGPYRDGAALYKTQEAAARGLQLSTHKSDVTK